MMHTLRRAAMAGLIAAGCAMAHLTWIFAPALEVGKPATVQIGHGHEFPASEEAINAAQVKAFAYAPSLARTELKPLSTGKALTVSYTPREAGLHKIVFTQDRGISSRTPTGVKPGGRDRNPKATQATRTLRTAVAYLSAGTPVASGGQPAGLEQELAGAWKQGAWHLKLYRMAKPVANAEIEIYLSGDHNPIKAGKTAADGSLIWKPASPKGTALFSAEWKEPAPAGSPFDFTTCETSLSASW
ncbi:MAG: DUF4198 domain-containing protein [Acidobacteria bacterium]|nr:DUF4198 domain-containing protein [Acidobacteriota bacterium]